jgi:ubiquinone/menaquinone biosynthesis C-methylase UbiE
VQPGDSVLDLGSGGGKICYMAAKLVGPGGRVIGVDMNDTMLDLARRHQSDMAAKLGGDRVRFVKARLQDLALDLDAQDAWLAARPLRSSGDLVELADWQARQRRDTPLIADASVDLVISNCVLNLVAEADRRAMLAEIARVLKPGGRLAISDIVADQDVPPALKADSVLWSGCISGAFTEAAFAQAFADAGLVGLAYDKWDAEPWQTVDGIEFRSATITGVKPYRDACLDYGHAVIYRGPFAETRDDEGHVYPRGERIAVCERSYRLLMQTPYAGHFIGIPPGAAVEPRNWCDPAGTRRAPDAGRGARHQSECGAPDCC